MIIQRPVYMERLIAGIGSDRVKVVTGIRRCGKSYLVFSLFKDYLLAHGVPAGNIFELAFDRFSSKRYRDPEVFYPYVTEQLGLMGEGRKFVLLDEVQLLDHFAEVLIDLVAIQDVDVYVTGSNARLLSKDVVTEFRGRGQEIAMAPLSFSEFMAARGGDRRDGYGEYAIYGGLPAVCLISSPEGKTDYLTSQYDELYIRDIVERNHVRGGENLEALLDVLSSSIGSLTNASRLSATFKSDRHVDIAPETIDRYVSYFEDSFLIHKAKRYDIKGRRYIGTPHKYYFTDLGLRNARMNFRQVEETHIMENVVYNELVGRGLGVDVGVVATSETGGDGRQRQLQLEVDFVCNRGSKRYYVQSAYALPTGDKREKEERSLLKTEDGFKKIIITKDGLEPHYNEKGILMMNVYDFLLDPDSLDL